MNEKHVGSIRLDKVFGYLRQPWCIAPDYFEGAFQAAAVLVAAGKLGETVRAVGSSLASPSLSAGPGRSRNPKRMGALYAVDPDGVGVITIAGVIGKKLEDWECNCGMVDVDDIGAVLRMAVEDQNVKAVLLDIDSPGGTITGVPELAEKIRAAMQVKPVVSYTDTLMASAGYWLGSQAAAVYAAPTAAVGSVGVYIPILDISGLYQKLGLKTDVVVSGTLKAMGYPGTSLTEAQREYLQARVTETHRTFMDAVRGTRGPIAEEFFQGQCEYAERAKKAGFVDSLSDYETARRDALALAA